MNSKIIIAPKELHHDNVEFLFPKKRLIMSPKLKSLMACTAKIVKIS